MVGARVGIVSIGRLGGGTQELLAGSSETAASFGDCNKMAIGSSVRFMPMRSLQQHSSRIARSLPPILLAGLLAHAAATTHAATQEGGQTPPPADPVSLPDPPAKDTYRIRFPAPPAPDAAAPAGAAPTAPAPELLPPGKPISGRLLLFFIKEGRRATRASPIEAPFYFSPQPLASIEIDNLASDKPAEVTIDGGSLTWPSSVDEFEGDFRVQALFRRNNAVSSEARGHLAPGNLYSAVKSITLHRESSETLELDLDGIIEEEPLPEAPNLKWIEIKSEILSASQGHDVMLRAGVAFPKDYDVLTAKRRIWPTIYVIPGFGGDHRTAEHYASMLTTHGVEEIAPQAVFVVLDPNGPLGHHGFVNAPAQGPRGEALVRELIPALEERFRLVAKPEARIVTGHSSGGWSSLWLQLQYPDVFGACFSSAPDPVDFTAFQQANLYEDENVFTGKDGREIGSFRQPIGPNDDRVMMTVREEIGVEHVLGPLGDSGEQWGAWAAMFGTTPSLGRASRLPVPAIDPVSGAIDRGIIERSWSRFDIARLVTSDWKRHGPILNERVRLLCGDRDSYYLNLAVTKLRDKVAALRQKDIDEGRTPPSGPGYIELVPRASHETIVPLTTLRWNKEMMDHFRSKGLHD